MLTDNLLGSSTGRTLRFAADCQGTADSTRCERASALNLQPEVKHGLLQKNRQFPQCRPRNADNLQTHLATQFEFRTSTMCRDMRKLTYGMPPSQCAMRNARDLQPGHQADFCFSASQNHQRRLMSEGERSSETDEEYI